MQSTDMNNENAGLLISLTADIIAAHVSHNNVAIGDLPTAIQSVHSALAGLGKEVEVKEELLPAVPIKASVKRDHLVCLEDGKRLTMMKRYLMTHYKMTPDEYRAKWGLPKDYPMVAPAYSDRRRALAQEIGLGGKGRPRNSTMQKNETAPRKIETRGGKKKIVEPAQAVKA